MADGDAAQHVFRLGRVLAVRGGQFGFHVAGCYRVDPDPVGGPFVGQGPGQPEEAVFGRGIGRHLIAALERVDRSDVDDTARGSRGAGGPGEGLGKQERCRQI